MIKIVVKTMYQNKIMVMVISFRNVHFKNKEDQFIFHKINVK